MINLKNRDFLKIADFSREELAYLLRLAARLKKLRKDGKEPQFLKGKNVALVFEKPPPARAAPLKPPFTTRARTPPIFPTVRR